MTVDYSLPFRIDAMALSDIPDVMAIERRAFPLAWTSGIYTRELSGNPWSHYLVLRPTTTGLTAVLSYGGVWQFDESGHIATIATHPDYAGRRLGSYVLIHLLLKAYEMGCTESTLEVRVSNTGAQALYEHYGFETIGHRRHYYSNNREDALIMTRPRLDPAALLEELAATEATLLSLWSTTSIPIPTPTN